MYSLIFTVLLIVNGVVSPDPVKVFEVKNGFPVEETCKNYLTTDEGTAFKKAVLPIIAMRMQGNPYVVGFSCISSESF